jgi:hypothetical protein
MKGYFQQEGRQFCLSFLKRLGKVFDNDFTAVVSLVVGVASLFILAALLE